MFTGLIGSVGQVANLRNNKSGSLLYIEDSYVSRGVQRGDSVAIDGACLTVREVEGDVVVFDVSPESLKRTIINGYSKLSRVNCELALRADDPIGGHFVLGHIDTVGTISSIERCAEYSIMSIRFDSLYNPLTVEKGSISINGVSLTINEAGNGFVRVMIIPHTLERTNLGSLRVSDKVNIEFDILGKYIVKFLNNQNFKDLRLKRLLQGQEL